MYGELDNDKEAGGIYHCAEKNNGYRAGNHYCIVLQLSVSRTSELHVKISNMKCACKG